MTQHQQQVFEIALRELGIPRLRMDQLVMAYQRAFPTAAMQPDMRQQIHDAVLALVSAGVLRIPETDETQYDDNPITLPHVVEMSGELTTIS